MTCQTSVLAHNLQIFGSITWIWVIYAHFSSDIIWSTRYLHTSDLFLGASSNSWRFWCLERLGGVFNLPWRLWNFWCVYPWCIYLLPRLGSVFKQFYPQSGTNIWDFLCVSWVGWGVGRSSRHFSALEFNLGPNLAASPQFFAFGFNLGLEYLGKVPGTRLLKTKAFEIIVSYWRFYGPLNLLRRKKSCGSVVGVSRWWGRGFEPRQGFSHSEAGFDSNVQLGESAIAVPRGDPIDSGLASNVYYLSSFLDLYLGTWIIQYYFLFAVCVFCHKTSTDIGDFSLLFPSY